MLGIWLIHDIGRNVVMNIPIYEKLFDYLRGTLRISCDAEVKELGEEEKRQVVEFLSEMAG